MEGFELSVSVEGVNELEARAQRIADAMDDLTAPFEEIGEYLTGFFSGEVFVSRGGIIGQPWPALTDRYAAYKAEHFPGRPPLIRTGTMQESFDYAADARSVTVYNDAPYFPDHQLGTSYMPARPMMGLDDRLQRQVVDIVDKHLANAVGAA